MVIFPHFFVGVLTLVSLMQSQAINPQIIDSIFVDYG